MMAATRTAGGCLAGLALAWLAGTGLQLRERTLMPFTVYVGCAGVALALFVVLASSGRWLRLAFLPVVVLASATLGFAAAGTRASLLLADGLDPALEGQTVEATGTIASLPQRGLDGVRFRFDVESARFDGHPVTLPSMLSLGWYRPQNGSKNGPQNGSQDGEDAAVTSPRGELRAGQRWHFELRLKQPHGNLNPYGFDYELSLFEQGVRATGYVHDARPMLLDRAAAHPIERLRQHVRDRIDQAVPDARAAGVLAALSVGDQSAIAHDDWDLFRATGIAHLVSISGLHVTMFAWMAGLAVGWLWRRSPRAMLWLAAPLAARWGGFMAAFGYALFSGWGVPSQRTVWMLGAVTLLQTLGVRWPWMLVLAWAAVAVSALDPWALLQAGFWLSFAAVGLLMASGMAQEEPAVAPSGRWGRLRGHVVGEVRTQAVATLGLTPLTLVFFQQISLVGFAANLIAIPLVTLVITPLALLGAFATPLWWAGAWLIRLLITALTWLGSGPAAVWGVPVAPLWAQAAGLLAGVLLLMPLPWRLRCLAVPLVLPLLVPPLSRPNEGEFELLALDVGQGTSVIVRTREHQLLYDTGPRYTIDNDAGQRVLLPLLRARGDLHIDRLMLSHRDLDHVGGAASVLRQAEVVEVSSSLEPSNPLRATMKRHVRCEAGQSWRWDSVRFDVLAPPAASYEAGLKSNAMSCVVRVSGQSSTGASSVLLVGDIEREQEAALVSGQSASLASDVLVAPHHGSKTSSTPAFLDAVHPHTAIFQAGYRNRFGHPAPDVIARYRQRDVEVITSPDCGAWRQPAGEAVGSCERDVARRYWQYVAR